MVLGTAGLYVFLSESKLSSLKKKYPSLIIIDKIYTEHILSVLRDKNTSI